MTSRTDFKSEPPSNNRRLRKIALYGGLATALVAVLLFRLLGPLGRNDAESAIDLDSLTPTQAEKLLVRSAQMGDLQTVTALLDRGVPVDATPALGITPLWQACWSNQPAVALFLLERGADPNAVDVSFQRSPLMLARDSRLVTELVRRGAVDAAGQLRAAALAGDRERVQAILAGRDFTPTEVAFAREHALLASHTGIARLLDEQSPEPQVLPSIPTADLRELVGTYQDARLQSATVRLAEDRLIVDFPDQPPRVLIPRDVTTFYHGAETYAFVREDNSISLETRLESRVIGLHVRDLGVSDSANTGDPAIGSVTAPSETAGADRQANATFVASNRWPQFRGLQGRGIAGDQQLPDQFGEDLSQTLRWATDIPGFATSSPIVWDDQVFVTTAVRSQGRDTVRVGPSDDARALPPDNAQYTWGLWCIDRRNGQVRWRKEVAQETPISGRHPKSSYANSTPVTNGEHVVALFGNGLLACWTLDGKGVWSNDLGDLSSGAVADPSFEWGFASSPIIVADRLIVQCDTRKQSYLAAFELSSGQEVWRRERDEPPSWTSPAAYPSGAEWVVVTCGAHRSRGYRLRDGKPLWSVEGMSATTIPTPQIAGETLYLTSGQEPIQPIIALRTGGLETPKTIWSLRRGGPYVTTPLIYRGHLYVCSTNGVLTCFDAATGDRAYRRRISIGKANSFSASPIAADGRLFFAAESGGIVEVATGHDFQAPRLHKLSETCLATPAIAGGTMLVRTERRLLAFGRVLDDAAGR